MGGGGGTSDCALSYASDSGAPTICQQGAKARERSWGRVLEGDTEIFFLFVYENGIFLHIECHYWVCRCEVE